MTTRGKAAAVSSSIVALVSLVLGSIYLVSPQFMPYHAAALGTAWAALESAEQTLILALMRVSDRSGMRLGRVAATTVREKPFPHRDGLRTRRSASLPQHVYT